MTPPRGPSVDLHSHTTFSDGLLDPDALVALAADAGVDVLALTDHDTVNGVAAAAAACEARGMQLIPGMEVSAHHDGVGVHVLAYFGLDAFPRIHAWQAERRAARRARLEAMLDRLDELGLPVDRAAVTAGLGPLQSPGRPHVARALLAAGHVKSFGEAFDRYLGAGKPAYVSDQGPSVADAIALIHGLPGLAVVAHPVFDDVIERVEALAELGLDGVEAYHPGHRPQQVADYQARAQRLGLLVTGGSDFHAPGDGAPEGGRRPGGVPLPPEEWRRFEAAYQDRIQQEPSSP
jgi:predicted metal-dependent phosphoesterase TrpH